MGDTVDKVAERLTKLEVTVAQGFHEVSRQFRDTETRDSELGRRIDGNSERLDRLESAVAKGFHNVEERDFALVNKIDVQTQAIREDLRAAVNAMNAVAEQARRSVGRRANSVRSRRGK